MNEAIRIAIEKGGYRPVGISEDLQNYEVNDNDLVLDPLFWTALGKALGWKETPMLSYGIRGQSEPKTEAVWHAHQYFDLLLTGGDAEKFFNDLLR